MSHVEFCSPCRPPRPNHKNRKATQNSSEGFHWQRSTAAAAHHQDVIIVCTCVDVVDVYMSSSRASAGKMRASGRARATARAQASPGRDSESLEAVWQ